MPDASTSEPTVLDGSPPPDAQDAPAPARRSAVARRAWSDAALPLLLYGAAFLAMTYPAVLSFGTHFFCDEGDGLQNVWNVWWTRKAVVELHQTPWFTTWLHHPEGTTLLGHTLSAFNGLVAVPLSLVLTPVQVFNTLVLLGFVGAGLGAFLLARETIGAWWPSLLAGFAFTFSGYHFAHAGAHLQLVSLEWVPVFVLCWIRLLRQPSVARALCAAAVLGLVILCDYYYFLYCVLAGLLTAAWRTAQARDPLLLARRPYAIPLGAFVAATTLTSGVLAAALLRAATRDPFVGAHAPADNSTDLLAPFVPGGRSAWRHLTEWYWLDPRRNIDEGSVYLGITVLALAALGLARRRSVRFPDAWLWATTAAVFYVLSLGPVLRWRGDALTGGWMPYRWLEAIFPPLEMSGCPGRMIVMSALGVSLLAAAGASALVRSRTPRALAVASALTAAVLADLWPGPLTLSRPAVPEWVLALRQQPGTAAVLDLSGTSPFHALYLQTLHEKPMAFGYVSRVPRSVLEADGALLRDIELGRTAAIRDERGFRYLVTDGSEPTGPGALHEGPGGRLYDLAARF